MRAALSGEKGFNQPGQRFGLVQPRGVAARRLLRLAGGHAKHFRPRPQKAILMIVGYFPTR